MDIRKGTSVNDGCFLHAEEGLHHQKSISSLPMGCFPMECLVCSNATMCLDQCMLSQNAESRMLYYTWEERSFKNNLSEQCMLL